MRLSASSSLFPFSDYTICEWEQEATTAHASLLQLKLNTLRGPKIVGAGWKKKTGTSSCGVAYELLGIVPHAFARMCRNTEGMDYFVSAEDFPTCCDRGLIATMKDRYAPDKLKFVLTERDPASWRTSVNACVEKNPWHDCWHSDLMNATFATEEFYLKYEAHNQYVKDAFKDTPDRLLVLRLMQDDGVKNMQKFCRFVGVNNTICNQPYPHENSQEYTSLLQTPPDQYSRAADFSHWEKSAGCDYEGKLSGLGCLCNQIF